MTADRVMADAADKYTSVPTTITAIQWDGRNVNDLMQFCGADHVLVMRDTDPFVAVRNAIKAVKIFVAANDEWLEIEVGEWVIRDELGCYPCKDVVFQKKYRSGDADDVRAVAEMHRTVSDWLRMQSSQFFKQADGFKAAGCSDELYTKTVNIATRLRTLATEEQEITQ